MPHPALAAFLDGKTSSRAKLSQLPRQLRFAARLRRPKTALRLHLGCGAQHIAGFVNIDMKITGATDYVTDISRLPCPDRSVERIETYHVIEHIPHPSAPLVLGEWRRVLQPGGILVVECPDFDEAVRRYLAGDEQLLSSIYGLQRYDGDTHYYGYNMLRLEQLLLSCGFSAVTPGVAQDYHASSEPCLRVEALA